MPYDIMGIFGPPFAHIDPIHFFGYMKSCFVFKDERVCKADYFKPLFHYEAEIRTYIFVIFLESDEAEACMV